MTAQMQQQAEGVAAASIPATATLMAGADPTGLLLGLLSAVFVTFLHGQIDSRMKAFGAIGIAALLSGYGAPVMGEVLLVQFPAFTPAIKLAGPLISLLIGALSPPAVVAASVWIKRKGDAA
jgi:hypothetical protein